ncbi:hypothetical protein [Nonomuraea sp. NPDC003754]
MLNDLDLYESQRKQHDSVLALLAERRSPLNIDEFCGALSEHFGQTILSWPFDPQQMQLSISCEGVTGLYCRVEDRKRPGVMRTVLCYGSSPDIPQVLQEIYFLHELGHFVNDDGRPEVQSLENLFSLVTPDLLEFLGGPGDIVKLMGRTAFRDAEERQAETFAILGTERLHEGEIDLGYGSHLAQPLKGWRGRRRG